MAIISADDVTDFVRSLIGETTAKHWSDVEIALYIKMGMMAIEASYWYMLAPLDKKIGQASLVANTAYVDIPDDCAKVIRVEVASTGDQLRFLEPDDLVQFEEYDDGAAATNYLNIWYLEHKDEVTDFPEPLRPLIALEAVIFGKTKDESVDAGLLALHKRFEDIALNYMGTVQMQEPTLMGDLELEDKYTYDDPVGWMFREGAIYLYKVRVGE